MAGLFSNQERRHLAAPSLEHGHWYLDPESNALFIVPDDRHGLAEMEGPDDATCDELNGIYREAVGVGGASYNAGTFTYAQAVTPMLIFHAKYCDCFEERDHPGCSKGSTR